MRTAVIGMITSWRWHVLATDGCSVLTRAQVRGRCIVTVIGRLLECILSTTINRRCIVCHVRGVSKTLYVAQPELPPEASKP